MFYRLVIAAFLLAAIMLQLFVPREDDSAERLAALETRAELLQAKIEELELRLQPEAPASTTAAATETGSAVEWRLGPGLRGLPLTVVEKSFERRPARVEVLLRVEAPLTDAADWPTRPGQAAPIRLTARDATGGLVLDQPMTLLRGTRQEPGAYLHLVAELPEQVAHRVDVFDLRQGVASVP